MRDLANIRFILEEIVARSPYISDPQSAIEENMEKFEEVLSDREDTPSNLWDFIGSGAYKMVYELHNIPWVVKFISDEMSGDFEAYLYERAKANGVGKFFLQSFYVPLDYAHNIFEDASLVDGEDWDEEDEDEEPYPIGMGVKWVAFQPLIKLSSEDDYARSYTYKELQLADKFIGACHEESDSCVSSWAIQAIQLYGEEDFERLLEFIEDFGITDLHRGNLGYEVFPEAECPVIFDWLSEDPTQRANKAIRDLQDEPHFFFDNDLDFELDEEEN